MDVSRAQKDYGRSLDVAITVVLLRTCTRLRSNSTILDSIEAQ